MYRLHVGSKRGNIPYQMPSHIRGVGDLVNHRGKDEYGGNERKMFHFKCKYCYCC